MRPDQRVRRWDRTWIGGHIPLWVIRRLRVRSGRQAMPTIAKQICLDHFGTILRDGQRVLVGMPYCYPRHREVMDSEARGVATMLGCTLEIEPAPIWWDGTVTYLFIPEKKP